MAKPTIKRLFEFQELLLKFRAIKRVLYIPPNLENENDVEHSYNLAMMAWFLSAHYPELDRDKLIHLALAHDILEVHSGDTFVFGSQAELDTKHERESKAVIKLAQEWPDFPELHSAITEYETRQTDEAKFVYALDKVMPELVNIMTKGYLWKKHGVTFERVRAEKTAKVSVSPQIWAYQEELFKLLQEHLEYFASPGRER